MLIYKTKESIKNSLIDSMEGGEGIYVRNYPELYCSLLRKGTELERPNR